jgi:hypothetical protein
VIRTLRLRIVRAGRVARQPWHIILTLVGLGVTTAIFYPEILTPGRILADYDVWTYFYPLRAYAVASIQMGRIPLWNPDTFLGAPFFANPQTALLYPGSALFLLLPVPYAYSLSVILHVLLTAAFTWAFLRVTIGVGLWPAVLGACAFAFGGAVSAQVGHINQLSATPWLSAIVLCTDLAYRRQSFVWAAAGALALAVQLLAGHGQVTYMTAWVVGLLLLAHAIRKAWEARVIPAAVDSSSEGAAPVREDAVEALPTRRWSFGQLEGWGRAILVGLAIGLPAASIAAVQLLPTAELSGESVRGGGMTYAEATAFSLPPNLLVRALLPGYWVNVPNTEFFGYVGTIPLFFAILALAFSRRALTGFAAAVAGIGLLLSLGGVLPLYRVLVDVVPGLDLFRVPARWLLVFSFGTSCLAALGLDWALRRPMPFPSIWRPPLVLSGFTLLTVVSVPFLSAPGRIVSLWVLGILAAGVLVLLVLREPGRAAAAACVVLSVFELRLAAVSLPARSAIPAEVYAAERDVPRHLALSGAPGRILSLAPTEYEVPDAVALARQFEGSSPEVLFLLKTALKLDEVMSPNVPLRYGLSTADGYDGGVLPLRRYLEIASLLVPRDEIRTDGVLRTRLKAVPDEAVLDFFDIRAVVAIDGPQPGAPGLSMIRYAPLRVFERAGRDRSIQLVERAEPMSDAAAIEALRVDPFSARSVVRIAPESVPIADDGPVALSSGVGAGEVDPFGSTPERLSFQRTNPGSGYLVIRDAWLPGWRAWIDGEETHVYRADVLFKAVWVPDGAQEIVLSYEPTSIRIGAALSVVGLLTLVVFLVLGARGRRLGLLSYNR